MIAVIQCAARKKSNAGHLSSLDNQKVMFVANPDIAPIAESYIYARPDDISDTGKSWRTVLCDYNAKPGNNPLGLLQAWQLYENPTYKTLADHFGLDQLYILSAGWGLISAEFLTPKYDITFSTARNVQSFKRRKYRAKYNDFCMVPSDTTESIVFFGGRDYIPLFCELTADITSRRHIFYAGNKLDVPGCMLQRFGDPYINWHYECAKAFTEGGIQLDDD